MFYWIRLFNFEWMNKRSEVLFSGVIRIYVIHFVLAFTKENRDAYWAKNQTENYVIRFAKCVSVWWKASQTNEYRKMPNLFRLVFNQIQWKTNEIMKTKKNLSFVNNWTEKRQFILVFCCFINRIRFQQSVNDIVDMNEWKLRLHVVWEIDMCRAIVNILLSFQHRFFH